jgi:hypothetical protein
VGRARGQHRRPRDRRHGAQAAAAVAIAGLLIACHRGDPTSLADYLTGSPDVATWQLDEPAYRRIVVASYRDTYADYAREFAAAAPALAAQLGKGGPVTTRAHFAGDPELTFDQAIARWALPTLYPSQVADVAGAPLDAVFVRDGERWRALVGIGRIVRARVAALDATCAPVFDVATPSKLCADSRWPIAEAALRTDGERLRRACQLAAGVCGKPTP